MNALKKLLILLSLFIAAPAFALGGNIDTTMVGPELRTRDYTIPLMQFPTVGNHLTSGTILKNGLLVRATLDSNLNHITWTSSIAAFPYPAKVNLYIADQNTTTIARFCTSTTIVGRDQFGFPRTETFTGTSSISEFVRKSTYAYEALTSVSATGCSQGTTDADDYFVVTLSGSVGLPVKITTTNAILSICFRDNSASSAMICYAPGTSDASLAFDNVGAGLTYSKTPPSGFTGAFLNSTAGNRVDASHSTVNIDSLSSPTWAAAIAASDTVVIRVRAPGGH